MKEACRPRPPAIKLEGVASKPQLTRINQMVEKNEHNWMQDLGRPYAREESKDV